MGAREIHVEEADGADQEHGVQKVMGAIIFWGRKRRYFSYQLLFSFFFFSSFAALVNAIAEKSVETEERQREVVPEELREKLLEEAEVVLKRYNLLLPTRDQSYVFFLDSIQK